MNQQVTLSATSAAQTSGPSGTGGHSSNSASASLQNSPSVTDDEDDEDDGAATSVSEEANDLVGDLLQPGRPVSTPQANSDAEDQPGRLEQAK